MERVGADIFCGRNTADAVLRGLHLLLREEQPELEDHKPPHLIYIYSKTMSQNKEDWEGPEWVDLGLSCVFGWS